MEDEERRRKLETGRAKLAEYRQKKAQSDGQKKQKKKRSKGSEQQEGGVLPEESGQRKDSSHYCLSRTIRSGETVTHDHTYTIEPESEVSTTAEDYSSEEEESRPLLDTTESQSHLQAMEDELREKNAALEELSRELDEIRAAFGTEGVQQLQEFEAALKQRDAIITQLTANLQQARTEKDDVMKEFLQLTEQSHKLQLQFQQLQAGETLRSSSISSTAADLLQTRQQVLYNQQQLEEKDTQVRGLQERLEEKDTQVKDLQEKLLQVAQLQQSLSHIQAVKREAEESFAQRLQEKDLQILQQEKLRSEQQQLLSQLQDNLQASKNNLNEISEQLAAKTRELEVCESELQTSRQKERLSSGEIQQLMGTVEDLQKRYHYKGADQGDAALKMAHLRAELDEMYGEQIVQMKQELSARHAEELAHIREQHSTELEKISENLKAKWTQSAGEANVLNARVVELQQKLQENQVLREKAEQDLAQMSEDKVFLHNRVQELVEDLRLAKQSKETEKSQMDLQVEIADLQAKLAAAQEASTELEAKHESEITNYQIKLEMLEREKDAVLDRMAESQEAELERLRTQLLFCHEEELSRLREDLQHENQMNMENLRDELRQVRNGYEAEKALLDAERASLLQEILVLKEDLSRALENSRVDELVSQLNELQTEIQELRKREGHREGTVLEGTSDSTWKDHLEAENKLLKEKEGIMVEELKSLRENREVLMKEIESFTADTEQANKLVEELKAEIERQKTTFSLAEKNFEVNYQKLREELEERIKEQMLQYEMKLQSLQTKLGTLEETDGGALVEKDTIELMEKLQEMEMVKAELEEKVEQKEMELQRIKAEKVELLKQKDMELQRVEGELQKVELEKVGLLKQKEVGLRRVKVEKAELLQKQQILALEEEVQELRRSLRSMGRDEDEDDEEGAEPVDDLLARPLAQREGEGESGERRTHTPYSASEQVGDEATEPTVTHPLRMEGSDHEECRLQMEALRISLSQIHAAQLELLKENLHKQGTVSRDEAVEQRFDQELQAQMVCDDQTERSVNIHILSAAGTELKGEEPELDRRLILEFREQRELQEQQHQQELQRLRSYYRQQVEETEERFQNEIVLLQSRLEELSGTSAVYSVQRVSPPVHQGAELLQDEVERVRERVSEERARDTEDLQRQRDEDIAKVIVQMCVEFAQQTELTRISRESENQERERLQEEIRFLQEKLDTLESLTQTQGAEQKQRMDGAQEESSRSEMQHPSMQSSGTQTLDSTHTTSGEGDEEEEKMEKEKEGVMSQLSSQDTERDLLRKANVKLCKVLMDVLKTTAATEETIGRHIEPQRDVSSQSLPSSEVTQEDTSVFSVETETDEGLEMSQMMLEAGLQPEGCGLQLEEANLQLEREEYLSTISSRLQSAVEKLLFTITETTSQLEHARLTQTELIKEKFRHAEEISELLRRQEELQEKLQEEASARQHLALQLHDAEGLIDGYSGERRALEQQLRERAELQLQLEQELQVTTNRLQELEQERNNVHHQRELLQRQQEAMRDGVSGRELRLVEAAGDAAPEADLLEETEKLMQEKVEVQLQAEKDHSELLQQVKHLEVELEEQEGRFTELEEAHRAETADFTQQISALEKQLENNRRFLDEQAVDREHERDVFQQEIQKLEQQLKNVPKPQPSSDQHLREVEELSGALKEKTDWCSELLLKVEQLQREVEEREEEIQKLESHNRELIANSLTLKSEEESKQYACMATGDDVTLESLLQTEREALDRKEKEIVNLEEQLEQFREELQNKSEEVQQLHMQLEIQRKEIHTQQQELHTQSHLHTVLEQKDREIILLSEHIAKLQLTQSSPDHQEVEEKSEELEAQVEYLRGEQERLKRDNEEEVERLNSVIEKLQQDLANIQHKQSLEEEEELKQKLEEELKEKMEEGLKQKMEEELKQDLKQRLEMELEQRMEEEMKHRMEEEQRPRMEEKLKQKMEEELKLDLKQRMEEEQKPRMEEELKQDLKNKMEVLKQRMEEELKQKMEDELKQDLKQKMEELRPSMQEELKLKMEEELKQDLNQKMEDLRPRMEEELKQKMEDELKQDQKQKMEELRPRMEEELKQKMEDGLKQDLKQKMDELRPRMEEQLKLKMEEELKQDLKQKMEELRPRMEEELKQKMEKDLNQKMEELRPRMEEELKQKMEDGLKQDLKQKMEELRPRMEEELKLKMEEELKQDLNQKIEELRPRMEEELKQKMEKDLKQKMEELKQRMEEEQRPSLEEELKQKMEDKLTQELKHKTEEVKHKMEEELKQDLKQNIEKELMQKMDEELKQKMDEVMKELDSLKVEHSSLLVSYESLQLEAMERYRQGDRSLVSLQESLQDALRERSAALLVAQAQVQALEESANSRMMDLTQRIEELQECVEEKEMELHACRLQVQRAKDDAQTLNLKISQLEDKLREKVAAVLVTQAQLEAVQVQAQTKEHHMDEEELELEEAAEDLTSEEIRKRNLCNPENFEHLGKEGRVGYLSEKLLGLEQGLSSMLRDQELQKELLNSSEEEVQEYHQRLNSLLKLLQQLRTTSAPTSAQAVSDGGSEMETVLQELQHVKDKAAETKGELNTCRERNLKLQEQIQMKEAVIEKLEEELQKASECEEDSRSASNLLQELQQVKDEAAETKEELTTCRELSLKLQEQIQEREMTIALLKDQLHRASGEVETSELLQELQEVREQAAEAKEELNSYIECSQKLQEQIQARDLSIAQMMEELQQLRSALSKPSEDTPASSQSRKKSAKHGEGKGKSSSAVAKDKLSVSRKSSDRSSNGSQTRSDAETQVQRNEQVSQELQEVISQYTERIEQMRELHAAEIMDMENRHISESESLKRENQRLEEECNALRATLNNIRTNEAVRLDLPASSQFRDGYASDSSSEWSQRTGFDPPHLQGEFRSTPEGARRDDSDIMSHRIKTLLREVHQEGMQVLSLSEISVPEAEHSSEQLPLEVWRREKEALLDNVESLKTLITQLQMHSQSQSETQTAGDWRADLLRAVQQVFLRERQVLKITLLTQLDLLDTRDSIIHLNQLERVLTEQDAVHQEALSSLQSADRHSLLSEISHLRAQLQHLQQAMPIPQQATPLSQQNTLPHLVDVTGMSEAQQKMGREKDGERDRQREEKVPPAVEDLKGELAQTKLELELSLKTQSKHLKELETLRAELCVKSSELDAQTDRLSEEQKRARELQWALEREKNRAERREEGEREELEDLRLALEDQKTHVSDLSLSLEEEKKVSSRLREERDGEISKQININSELQVQLDAQKLQVVELSSSLQKEKEMNVQMLKQLQFSSSESQRPLQAMSEEGVDQAEASCSQVEEGVACVELLLQSLQDQLSEKQKTLAETMEKLEVQKLQEVQVKGAFAQERTEMSRRLQEATESLNALHTRAQELQTLLDGERERGTRLERERDTLQRRVSEVMERSQRDNQAALRGAEGHSADRTRDWVLQQKAEESGNLTSSSAFGVDAAGQTTGQNKNLDNVVNRLQLIASRINTMTSSASSLPQEGPDREALSWLHSNVQDVLTLLQPTQTAPPAVPESATLLTGGSSSALTERLLRQNAELTGFVSRLTEEKNELRNQLLRLEEELRRQRHLSTHSSVKSGSEGQELVLFSGERESWMREKKRLEKSLRETEAELSRLRGEMRSDTIRDITTSDTDNTALKRMYGKYLRAESFRKALIYQKKYLLLLLGGFQECEEATLSLIARMGGRPSYPQLDTITQRRRGFTRFRSAVRVSIALSRMRFLVRRWKKASGGSLMSPTIISRNGLGQSPGTEGRNDSPYLQPSVEQYGERRGTNRTGRESPRAGHYTHHRCGVAAGDGGSVLCSHLQNYDPDRALSDYISRLEALQRRLGSVQSGSSSYAQLHFGIRR
ncbi:A-kinase anchor protein 9 isoform X2 [Hoplias malabaricus]|uniref:A-kinase anchor protein 9 isoform X2 n=1 Tax=Hoplias malabaricus TaxID=27720 RepID=UPI0034618D7B